MIYYATPQTDLNQLIRQVNSQSTIRLAEGTYNQKVLIDKPDLTIEGAGARSTVISFDDYAKKIHADGKEYNTFRTYTLNIIADNVTLRNLTVINTNTDPSTHGQCVALSVYAHNVLVDNCNLISTQDTVFNGPLPNDLIERYVGFLPDRERVYHKPDCLQIFRNCLVCGTVDFIFGCANAFYIDCEIRSLNDGRDVGYVCAPAHAAESDNAINFIGCNFTYDGAKPNSVYLARPWRDYGQATFVQCQYAAHINQLAFDKWNDTNRDQTARFFVDDLTRLPYAVTWAKQLTEEERDRLLTKSNALRK